MSGYAVDLDELATTIADLADTGEDLAALSARISASHAALDGDWEGRAAAAHAEASVRWEQGLAAMHDALARMRAAAGHAHGCYSRAAGTNVDLWRGLG